MFGYVVVDIVIRHSSNDFHVPFECHAAFILGDQSVMAFERIIEDVGAVALLGIEAIFRICPRHEGLHLIIFVSRM